MTVVFFFLSDNMVLYLIDSCLVILLLNFFFRSGSIFNVAFISNLLNPADDLPNLSDQLKKVLESIRDEALCSDSDVSETNERDQSRGGEEPDPKRPKLCNTPHPATAHPPFYINIHKKKFKDIVIPK